MVQDLTETEILLMILYYKSNNGTIDENGNIVVSVYENGEKISEFLVDAEV